MALLDLLSRRWALRILWELRTAEPTFRELQQRCGSISSSVLSDRLRELGEAGIVAHSGQGYTLTPAGHDLLARLLPLNEWGRALAAGGRRTVARAAIAAARAQWLRACAPVATPPQPDSQTVPAALLARPTTNQGLRSFS